ncbi:hypothetical protein GCM10022286_07140 [Gryllotalpicola daejeonensis]|uniref:OsmC family peroxiredoxin n=1 Tax=Gryllotalpicola daejeonensis TaxID=993087 RepID=A0ABP7ZG27_9MICO
MSEYEVVAGAGSLRVASDGVIAFPHRWTAEGVAVDAAFSGAHLLNLAVAGCVLNDVYREAGPLGVAVRGVRVRASGGFDAQWRSTGIRYVVELDADASPDAVSALLQRVDEIAEIPQAVRAGAVVQRAE